MARPLRIEFNGAWYWISNRGLYGQEIFRRRDECRMFLQLLEQLPERFQMQVHGYCLLPDAYHLLVHTPVANLAACMRHLQSLYTQRYNRSREHEGPLFRGRYQSTVIQAEKYLLPLSALLHHMPVGQALACHAVDYPWSSCAAYYGRRSRLASLQRAVVQSQLPHMNDAYAHYQAGPQWLPLMPLLDRKRQLPMLGDNLFKQQVLRHYQGDHNQLAKWQRKNEPASLEHVLESVAAVLQVKRKALYEGRRGQLNVPRMMAIYLSHCRARLSLNQLARHFGMAHYSSASSAMQRYQRLRAREGRIQRLESEVLRHLEPRFER